MKAPITREPESSGSATDSGLAGQLTALQRENEELRCLDAERGEVHKKLKKRVLELKKEMNQQKEANRKQARDLKKKAWDAEQRTKNALLDIDIRVAYGTANLERPGMTPLTLPDPYVESRRAEMLRNYKKVWNTTMRLGVFHQYSPRPMLKEKFPKPAASGGDLPKVSVVTPSFRQAEFLERTMLSVLNENYPKLEYFVMDGGSTDGSEDVIKKHESKLAGWVCEKDRGASDAINKGFVRATGDIMAWLNSDDLWMPGVLRFVTDYFAKHPEVDVVYGHRLIIDQNDYQVGHWVMPKHDGEILLWADYMPQETMFWRRSIWEKVGACLDASFSFAFDWDILLRFQKAGANIVRLPYFMGSFRVHDSQKSTAEISSAGIKEMTKLRDRELGDKFNEQMLSYQVVRFQTRALRCERLRKLGIRW